MAMPSKAELCKQVFLAQPKPCCIKYAEKHRVFETDIIKLQEVFEGIHDAKVHSGEYKRFTEGQKRPKKMPRPRKGTIMPTTTALVAMTSRLTRIGMIIDLSIDIIMMIVAIMIKQRDWDHC
jgi:hypothetical protein